MQPRSHEETNHGALGEQTHPHHACMHACMLSLSSRALQGALLEEAWDFMEELIMRCMRSVAQVQVLMHAGSGGAPHVLGGEGAGLPGAGIGLKSGLDARRGRAERHQLLDVLERQVLVEHLAQAHDARRRLAVHPAHACRWS